MIILMIIFELVTANFLDIPILRENPFDVTNLQNNTDYDNTTVVIFDNYDPLKPLIKCNYLPYEYIWCEEPVDLRGNQTLYKELGYGCLKWIQRKEESVVTTKIRCHALKDIECHGNRTFFLDNYPCIKYSGHYFLSTLICSIMLGVIGIDRFILGHTGTAVGKALTLGGFGIWWIVDIILLIKGNLVPADGSAWMPNY